MQITFIIPCFNAETFIHQKYFSLNQFLKKNKIKKKIIFINDGSKDNTLKKLKEINDNEIKIINNKVNLGKSKSIIKALKKVKTKNVVLIDCDLPYFEYLNKIIRYLKSNDLVIINRKHKKSVHIEKGLNFYKILRKIISNFLGYYLENKLNLNVSGDTQAGLKAFRLNDMFKKYRFYSKYYFFDIELIHFFRQKKLKIKLVPVKFEISDKSTIKIFSFRNLKIISEFFRIINKIKT